MKNKRNIAVITLLMGTLLMGCTTETKNTVSTDFINNQDTMYQVETLQSLMLGNYYGFATVKDIKNNGDIGLGTFDKLDGEMIVLDGIVYQAKGDGSVVECEDSVTSPFCSVTKFEQDITQNLTEVTTIQELKDKLDECIKDNRNIMYAAKMEGTFDSVTIRSEKSQQEPYKKLAEVLKTDQVVFPKLTKISGTVIAVYFPDYMDGINTPGWHLHFISKDHKAGGHVMELAFNEMQVYLDATTDFHMLLPNDENYAKLKLTTDLDDEISEVEGGKK